MIPPSCGPVEFTEVLAKISDCIYNMPSPLPHIIFLGDFNLPNIDCINARMTGAPNRGGLGVSQPPLNFGWGG